MSYLNAFLLTLFAGFSTGIGGLLAFHKKAASTQVIDKLDAYLGYPKFCQHGHPIPDAKGRIHHQAQKPLTQYEVGDCLKINRATDTKPLLGLLNQKGLTIGDVITIKAIDTFNDMMIITKGEQDVYLSLQNA